MPLSECFCKLLVARPIRRHSVENSPDLFLLNAVYDKAAEVLDVDPRHVLAAAAHGSAHAKEERKEQLLYHAAVAPKDHARADDDSPDRLRGQLSRVKDSGFFQIE